MCHIALDMLSQTWGEKLYIALRNDISKNLDVEYTVDIYSRKSELCGERGTAVIEEALEKRNWEDGQNHLMYAACLGKKTSFISLVKIIRKTVSRLTVSMS